jgi:thiol-disulfide isomerase/thioredoxin
MNFIKKNLSNIIFIAVLVLLYFTGMLSRISTLSQTAIVKSGFVDADPESSNNEHFDYNFSIKDLEGNKMSFEQFKGKVIFLNMWATWCGPCKAEMPSIQNLHNQVDHTNIEFVMLSIDRDKDLQKARNYIANQSYTFPVYMPSGYLTEQLNVPSIPTTFVISKSGKIVMKEVGMKNYDTSKFKKFLEKLASE